MPDATDLTLTVDRDAATLTSGTAEVRAAHSGVSVSLAASLADLERSRLVYAASRTERERATAGDRIEIDLLRAGQLLADCFLPEPLREALRAAAARAAAEGGTVRLGVLAGHFARMPWEILPDPLTRSPAVLQSYFEVYRRRPPVPARALPGPLRIVVAIAAPTRNQQPVLDYERELRQIHAAVRASRRANTEVRVVQFATAEDIHAELLDAAPHVLHISAHGRPGVIELEDRDGNVRDVDAETMVAEAIPVNAMPPVVVLAACSTNVPGSLGVGSFAQSLSENGAGVVIATETSISDRYATEVFSRIYQQLAADRAGVLQAVCRARRDLYSQMKAAVGGTQRLGALHEWSSVSILMDRPGKAIIDAAAVRSRPPQAPSGSGRGQIIGRRDEQRYLPRMLLDRRAVVLVIHGLGGSGKTTLAEAITARLTSLAPGVQVVRLFGACSVDSVLAKIGTSIADDRSVPWRERWAVLRRELNDRPLTVILLDNFEDNLYHEEDRWRVRDPDLAALLEAVVDAPGSIRLLITSRYPIKMHDPSSAVHHHPLGPLSLAETYKFAWALPHLDDATDGELTRLWQATGGHPRMLQYIDALLGASRAAPPQIASRISQAEMPPLERGPGTVRTLDQAIAESALLAAADVLLADLLAVVSETPGAVELLERLSVYREPVPLEAARYQISFDSPGMPQGSEVTRARLRAGRNLYSVARGGQDAWYDLATAFIDRHSSPPPLDIAEVREYLRGLVEVLSASGLLNIHGSNGQLSVHPWTAEELRSRVADPALSVQAHRNAAAYWLDRVRQADGDEAIHDLVEARHHLAGAGETTVLTAFTKRLCQILNLRGFWDQEAALINLSLAATRRDDPDRIIWIFQRGSLSLDRGDLDAAERDLIEVVEEGRHEASDEPVVGLAHDRLGTLYRRRYRPTEARKHYTQAIAIFERLVTDGDDRHDRKALATALHNLAGLAAELNDHQAITEPARRARDLWIELGDTAAQSLAQSLLNEADQRSPDEAVRHFTTAAKDARRSGDLAMLTSALGSLARALAERGDPIRARAVHEDALVQAERINDRIQIAWNFLGLGRIAAEQNELSEADRRLSQALALFHELGIRREVLETRRELGHVAFKLRQFDRSETLLRDSYDANDDTVITKLDYFFGIGTNALASERYEEALPLLRRAAQLADELPESAATAAVYSTLAMAHGVIGELPEAATQMVKTLRIQLQQGLDDSAGHSAAFLAQVRDLLGHDALTPILENQVPNPTIRSRMQAAISAVGHGN